MANGNDDPPDRRGLAALLFELGIDITPGVGDVKALLYDAPRSLRDAWHADTPLGKAGHVGLATLAGLSAVPFLGAPLDAARAAVKVRRLSGPDRVAYNRSAFEGPTYYHGTHKPMDSREPWQHLEPSTAGQRGPGIYGTLYPERATIYTDSDIRPTFLSKFTAAREQPRVYPFVARQDRLADLSPLHDWSEGVKPSDDVIERLVAQYGEVVRPPTPRMRMIPPGNYERNIFGDILSDRPLRGRDYANYGEYLKRRNERLRQLGYQGIRSQDEVIIFDPTNVRSPWAAFEDLKSRDMLAGLAGLGFSARLARSREEDG